MSSYWLQCGPQLGHFSHFRFRFPCSSDTVLFCFSFLLSLLLLLLFWLDVLHLILSVYDLHLILSVSSLCFFFPSSLYLLFFCYLKSFTCTSLVLLQQSEYRSALSSLADTTCSAPACCLIGPVGTATTCGLWSAESLYRSHPTPLNLPCRLSRPFNREREREFLFIHLSWSSSSSFYSI